MNRNQKILAGLVAILALTLAYRLTNPFQQETVDRLTYAPARTVASKKAETGSQDQVLVRLDLLREPPKSDVKVDRDPFQPPRAAAPASPENPKPSQAAPPPKPQSPREKVRDYFRGFKTFFFYYICKITFFFFKFSF